MLPWITLLLCSLPQSPGGGFENPYHFDGGHWGDRLGWAVSPAGDINSDGFDDFLISAKYAAPGGQTKAGSVMAYSGADGSLIHQWDGSQSFERLGWSLSPLSDINNDGVPDLLIGAYTASFSGTTSGSAFAYSGTDGSLIYRWNGENSGDQFGNAVIDMGDMNADGISDIAVSAPKHDSFGATDSGAIYFFSGADGTQLAILESDQESHQLGWVLANAGDINLDGVADILTGYPFFDSGSFHDAGAAYLFSGADQTLLLKWNGTEDFSQFGDSLTGVDDQNHDGIRDILITAPRADTISLVDSGSVFLYSGADGSLLQQWDGQQDDERFGDAIAVVGDANSDGSLNVLVGASLADSNGLVDNGSAFLLSSADGTILHRWNGRGNGFHFGSAVNTAGDVNGNGIPDIIVGASLSDHLGGNSAGAADVFTFLPYLQADTASLSATNGGTIQFDLDFPSATVADEYKVLLSATGTGPTTYGITIPLTQDSFVFDSFQGNYPTLSSNMHGNLDLNRQATASLTISAGLPASLIGRMFYFAAITNPAGLLPQQSSIAVEIEITL